MMGALYDLPTDSSADPPRKPRCPLHKNIRSHRWPTVATLMHHDPSQICRHNSVGWSSLTLAIYHLAPPEIISAMLALISHDQRASLLSTPVPNGKRLCLHFASRYARDLEVIRLIAESYPHALLVKSNDGVTPLDRAVYYRKDGEILSWLGKKTEAQKAIYEIERYNRRLRDVVVECCEVRWANIGDRDGISEDNAVDFVSQVYGFAKERAMIALFWDVLSYVGIHNIPT